MVQQDRDNYDIKIMLSSFCCILGSFDLLVYTDKDLNVPEMWEESGPCIINNSEDVRLRSFSTTIHKVDTMVSYKSDD